MFIYPQVQPERALVGLAPLFLERLGYVRTLAPVAILPDCQVSLGLLDWHG
jgi:hypothetical protein